MPTSRGITSDKALLPASETPDAGEDRVARERRLLDHANHEIEAGRYIPDDEVDAWLDGLVAGDPVSVPGELPTARKSSRPR